MVMDNHMRTTGPSGPSEPEPPVSIEKRTDIDGRTPNGRHFSGFCQYPENTASTDRRKIRNDCYQILTSAMLKILHRKHKQ